MVTVIKPYVVFCWEQHPEAIMAKLEQVGRIAFRGEALTRDRLIRDDDGKQSTFRTPELFVRAMMQHRSEVERVLRHVSISVVAVISQRTCQDLARYQINIVSPRIPMVGNNTEIIVVEPSDFGEWQPSDRTRWLDKAMHIEKAFRTMCEEGSLPCQLHDLLPRTLKTEVFMTLDLWAWGRFFDQALRPTTLDETRFVAREVFDEFKTKLPAVFDTAPLNVLRDTQ